jgi:hypothetical protein
MRDDGNGKLGRERVRRDALSSVRFMLGVWTATYVVSKVVFYFAHTAYVEATFHDALYFELGMIIFTAVVLIRTLL